MPKYKLIISILLTAIASSAYSFAVETYDCKLLGVINEGSGAPKQLDKKFSYLLDEENITTALQNTRAYCCSAKLITDKDICNNADSANNFPESPYLYDHLVDVEMTRRDGRDDNAYGITVDPKTKEYREYMDKVATLPEGKKPDDIILKIKELRIPTGTPFILGYTPEICKAKAKRDTLKDKTLYEKLANVCTVARCAYDAMTKNQTNRDSTIATALGYEKCQDMITAKVYSEFEYMNTIINEAANRKLINGTNQYLTNYFARDRLINLQNKIGETYDAFAVVNRFVQEGTKQCSG